MVRLVEAVIQRTSYGPASSDDKRLDDAMQEEDQACVAAILLTDRNRNEYD